MAKKVKAAPRGARSYPQEARVFSKNFMKQFMESPEVCFVPLSDFSQLEKKYLALFKRYRKTVAKHRSTP